MQYVFRDNQVSNLNYRVWIKAPYFFFNLKLCSKNNTKRRSRIYSQVYINKNLNSYLTNVIVEANSFKDIETNSEPWR